LALACGPAAWGNIAESEELTMNMRRAALALGVGTAVAVAAAASGADWPGWRGPGRDARSPETGLLQEWPAGGPPVAWSAKGLGAGLSSVAVVGNRIYTMGDKDGAQHVLALDEANGKVVWSAKVGEPWVDEYGGPRCTPTVDAGSVYALGSHGDLVAHAATGKERWRKHMEKDLGGRMSTSWLWSESPLVDGDRLIVTPGARDAALVALDKRTGAVVWKAALPDLGGQGKDGAGYSSVVISEGAGVKQYVQLLGRGVVGVRASDGKFLWGNAKVANGVANIATPIVKGNHVFASTGYQTGSVLLELSKLGDGVSAREVYFLAAPTFQNHHGGMVLVGDHVYAGHGHNKGFPICVELMTGKVAWGGDIRNQGTGSAAVMYADGRIYMRYQNGVVVLVEASPKGYAEKGSFTIPNVTNPSWPHLVVSDGRLYVREQDTLYAYDIRRKG
jgi:outer membrane protein assembly factor BamB